MKRAGSILALSAGVALAMPWLGRADTSGSGTDNSSPYSALVARNVFGLNPPPPPGPATPVDPPPKIIPNGIMTILGKLQVLFKVENNTPGQPGKEPKSYMLSVGQMEDDITVLSVDQKSSIISFNNHGTTQDLPLVAATSSGPGPGGPPPGIAPPAGAVPIPTRNLLPGGRFNNPAFRGGQGMIPPMSQGNNPPVNNGYAPANNGYNPSGQTIIGAGPQYMANSSSTGNGTTQTGNNQQQLSAEAQAINMAAQIDNAKQRNDPILPLLPPPPLPGYINTGTEQQK